MEDLSAASGTGVLGAVHARDGGHVGHQVVAVDGGAALAKGKRRDIEDNIAGKSFNSSLKIIYSAYDIQD